MVRCSNEVYIDEEEAFFLIHMDSEDTITLMDGLRELGVEGNAEIIYCG